MARARTYMVLDVRGRPLGTVRAENGMDAFTRARRQYGEAAHTIKRTGSR